MKFSRYFALIFLSGLSLLSPFSNAQNFDIYVSDAGNFNNPPWQILKFDHKGENAEIFIDEQLNWPQDILFLEDSNTVLISNLGTGKINRHDAKTGAFISTFADGIGGPTRIKIGPDSLLYVLQWTGNNLVKRYRLDGTFVDDFTEVAVPQSIGLDWDREGNLYVSSYNGDMVRKFDKNGKDSGQFISNNLAGPTNIWFNDSGDLMVSDYDGGAIKRFDSTGKYLGVFIPGLNKSEGIAIYPNGDLLIGNGGSSSVKLYDKNGQYKQDLVLKWSGNLKTPNAVVLRESKSTGSSPAIKKKGIPRVYPTPGDQFKLKTDALSTIQKVTVYNSHGQRIKELNINRELIWDARTYPEGYYILLFQSKNGHSQFQKVGVHH